MLRQKESESTITIWIWKRCLKYALCIARVWFKCMALFQDNTEGHVWRGSSEPCSVPFQTSAFLVIRNKCKRSFGICFLIEHLKSSVLALLELMQLQSWTSKQMLEGILNILGKYFGLLSPQKETPIH